MGKVRAENIHFQNFTHNNQITEKKLTPIPHKPGRQTAAATKYLYFGLISVN